MLDVHPEPDGWREVQTRVDGQLVAAGRLERTAGLLADIHSVRRLVDDAVVRGVFRWRAARCFESIEEYDTPDSWEARLASAQTGRLDADEPLLRQALDLMPERRAEILLRTHARAVALVRV
ncbi:MAG: hypothetical protein V3S18_06345 [Dehalococcoidia bacterium]